MSEEPQNPYPRVKREKDLEAELAQGCFLIGASSIGLLILLIWPYFTTPIFTVADLTRCILLGLPAAMVIGAIFVRKFGPSGLAAAIGGPGCSAIFVYLYMRQTMTQSMYPDQPDLEYPQTWGIYVPFLYLILTAATALIFYPWKRR